MAEYHLTTCDLWQQKMSAWVSEC